MLKKIKLDFNPFYIASGKLTNRQLRGKLGVDYYTITRANNEGLTIDQADIWCEKLEIAPYEIWSEWIDLILSNSDQLEIFA